MKISQLESDLGYKIITKDFEDREADSGYTSDLLSDVMGNAPADSVFITIQAHKNTIAVATLAGVSAIVICGNRQIPEDMIQAAKEEEIAIFQTQDNQFTASCKIGQLLA
ncbi:DRTGG domain-containing protein [Spirochaeta cellobiosiphila]|uniref:DRTGG domain-containing protein n=1 Tax=Spirochaeta cellobiosiphila TaxID=504483 RepID=UPI00042992DF|nr:DRTGG domain-containing protein [Spirochaeta cellobiosiphila]